MCARWESNNSHDMAECYHEPDWEMALRSGFFTFFQSDFSVSLYVMLSRKLELLTFRVLGLIIK